MKRAASDLSILPIAHILYMGHATCLIAVYKMQTETFFQASGDIKSRSKNRTGYETKLYVIQILMIPFETYIYYSLHIGLLGNYVLRGNFDH
jgi:hypothetical protein